MSRFYAGGNSSSSETESSDDEQIVKGTEPSRFAASSESEEEEKRVVRSARDKRYEELNSIVKTLKNHKKIKDMSNVLTDFEALTRSYEKAKKVVTEEGVPKFYIKSIAELETFINEMWEDKEGRKQLSKISAKSLTTVRQKVRKYNKGFEKEIQDFQENPEKYEEASGDERDVGKVVDEDDDDEVSEESSLSDDDFIVKKKLPVAKAKKPLDALDDDDSDWPSSSDETSSSDDDDYVNDPASRFLKKPPEQERKEKEKRREKKEQRAEAARAAGARQRDQNEAAAAAAVEEGEGEGEGWTSVDRTREQKLAKIFEKTQDVNGEAVLKKLNEVISMRGKRSTDRVELVDILVYLQNTVIELNLGLGLQIKVLMNIIASIFDANPSIAGSMRSENWDKCLIYISQMFDVLEAYVDERMEDGTPFLNMGANVQDETESLFIAPFRVNGCILTLIERMDDEFTKILQNTDAHSTEYVDKLRHEQILCENIDRLCRYMERRHATSDDICRSYLRKIMHIYYKFDREWAKEIEAGKKVIADSYQEMRRLCRYIYERDTTHRLRTRAILFHIYYLAIHDHWFEARDVMLMSNLQASIDHSDIPTMIIYNRAMVQLGLCAFRMGYIRDAHQALVDIQSSGRAKELLAQGLMPARFERTVEQEKLERRRQMPYHMHVNTDLLECVYLTSAMLLEIPYMAAHETDVRKRMISKNFHHVLKNSEKQTLVGPPETMREHIVAASKAMRNGDWEGTLANIINVKMNARVWDLFFKAENVKSMLEQKIKEECLRTYLFTYSPVYDSISLVRLAELMGLTLKAVESIVHRMILNEELMASVDEPTHCLVMHKTELTRIQTLALQLAEKVNALTDYNDRLCEIKQNQYQYNQKGQTGQQSQQNQQSGRRQGGRTGNSSMKAF